MWIKRLTIVAVLLACCVVALGAYTRLKNAGLGCPDWPGCYGQLTVPETHAAIHRANEAYPDNPVHPQKAWAEMTHRYFASTLGLLIVTIFALSLREHRRNPHTPLRLPLALLCLVIMQGMLGMWTVTLKLFPTVVTAHLLGGFTTLCLLFLLTLRVHFPSTQRMTISPEMKWGLAGILILGLQIALGGWTAANYAGAVCKGLPICQAGWEQHINLHSAFKFWGFGDVTDYEYATHIAPDAKITIHAAHRIGAMITFTYLFSLFLAQMLRQTSNRMTRRIAGVAMLVLFAQVSLGISNVVFDLPLAIAVAHNGVAALLMMCLILLNFSLYRAGSPAHEPNSRVTSASHAGTFPIPLA